ncbi:hypothetical protein WME99_12610 [Sorangium sp. So ce136]|uniref:hypothetical protein n=1 Tax=Sorangium sp. So ce136 TaxID=3133284 RepID=UPI003EFE1BCE
MSGSRPTRSCDSPPNKRQQADGAALRASPRLSREFGGRQAGTERLTRGAGGQYDGGMPLLMNPLKKPGKPAGALLPHPATVVQPKRPLERVAEMPPHPATVVQGKVLPPHPATVMQSKRPLERVAERPPHPATVVQGKMLPPRPATVVPLKRLFEGVAERPPHPALARFALTAQRMESHHSSDEVEEKHDSSDEDEDEEFKHKLSAAQVIECSKELSQALGVPHYFLGGLAAVLHGYGGIPGDIDVLVAKANFKTARDNLKRFAKSGTKLPFPAAIPYRVHCAFPSRSYEILVDLITSGEGFGYDPDNKVVSTIQGIPVSNIDLTMKTKLKAMNVRKETKDAEAVAEMIKANNLPEDYSKEYAIEYAIAFARSRKI